MVLKNLSGVMCNYQYKKKLPLSFRGDPKCSIPMLFAFQKNNLKRVNDDRYTKFEIPIDNDGKCLFHSDDELFKIKHNIYDKFVLLGESLKSYDQHIEEVEDINLSELKVGILSELDQGINIEMDGFQVLNLELYFDYSIFHQSVSIAFCDLTRVSFANCTFKGELAIMEGSLNINFHRCRFESFVNFDNLKFTDFIDFSYSKFHFGLNILDCHFAKEVIFSYCHFEKHSPPSIIKISGRFEGFTDFTECIFDTFFIIDFCTFDKEVNFTNSVFNTRFFFKNNEVKSNFYLKGKSRDQPIFRDLIDLEIKDEDLLGKIIFENASFFKINEAHKKNLLELEKKNKVEIGSGCIKYKLQTDKRKIDLTKGKQAIALEFTHSFVNYFLNANGLNLGVELIDRNQHELTYFFYSDENISELEFYDRLNKTEEDFLSLIFLSEAEENRELTEADSFLNRIDGFASLLNIFIKVGSRISMKKWNEDDTQRLLDLIKFDGESRIDNQQLHQLISDQFNKTTIINKYFLGDYVKQKIENPVFHQGSHQFADKIINRNSDENE